jgi:hypothetical protein
MFSFYFLVPFRSEFFAGVFLRVAVQCFPPTHFILGQNNKTLDSLVFLFVAGSYQFIVRLHVKDELAYLDGSGGIFLYALADGGNLALAQEEGNLAISVELAHLLMLEAESLTALTGIASVGYAVAL